MNWYENFKTGFKMDDRVVDKATQELEAIKLIFDTLRVLRPEQRVRVLRYSTDLLSEEP